MAIMHFFVRSRFCLQQYAQMSTKLVWILLPRTVIKCQTKSILILIKLTISQKLWYCQGTSTYLHCKIICLFQLYFCTFVPLQYMVVVIVEAKLESNFSHGCTAVQYSKLHLTLAISCLTFRAEGGQFGAQQHLNLTKQRTW